MTVQFYWRENEGDWFRSHSLIDGTSTLINGLGAQDRVPLVDYCKHWDKEAFLAAQTVKNLPAMQETWVQPLGREDPLEKKMATHFSVLAWNIPWTEKPGGLQSIGWHRVGHNWSDLTSSMWFLPPAMYTPPLITATVIMHFIYSTRKEHLHLPFKSQCQYPCRIYHLKINY